MSRNSEKPTVTVNKFPGLNTVDDPVEVGHTGLVRALNVDITRQRKIKRRKGATRITVMTTTAAWAEDGYALINNANLLFVVQPDLSLALGVANLASTGRLCAKVVGKNIYYSDGVVTGVIENGTYRDEYNKECGYKSLFSAFCDKIDRVNCEDNERDNI